MAKVARNELCPCGSGRKYKQCCMGRDQAMQVRGLSLRRDDELLSARLMAYGQRPAFLVDLSSAFSRFWNGDFTLDAAQALGPGIIDPFLEWYLYDYRTTRDRQRLIDLFVAEEGQRLPAQQRVLLAEREAAYLGLYGVEAVEPGGRMEIGDLLVGGFYEVEDAGLARLAMPGDILLGRRLGDGERSRLSRGTVLLPGTLGPGLAAAAKQAYGVYRDEHYQAPWPEFLREAGFVMFHYLLTPAADEAYARAPRREGYFDPREGVERMRAIMRRHTEDAAKRAAEEEARRREERQEPAGPPIERTAGGILIPGQSRPPQGSEGGILLPGQVRP
ncbi:MAG: SEC-C domain-containing protein [Anaerolineae bacterium]